MPAKCSAWEAWDLVDDKMIPTSTCQRDAEYLLSNPPHWENQPYCASCAGWMMAASDQFHLQLIVETTHA